MADPKITIGLKTTGASRAADDINDVGDAAGDLTEKLEDLNDGSSTTADATDALSDALGGSGKDTLEKGLKTASEAGRGLGSVMGGPLSRALTALSGGPVAVLAAAVGLATQAFFKWRDSLRKAEEEGLERVAESAARAAVRIKELRAAASSREFDAYKDSLVDVAEIQRQLRIDADTIGLGAARERANASLDLLRQTGRLSEVEKALSQASGNDALRLAQERLDIVEKILDAEIRISEVTRSQALALSESRLAASRSQFAAADTDKAAAAQLVQERELRLAESRAQFENARGLAGSVEILQAKIDAIQKAPIPFAAIGADPDSITRFLESRNAEIAGLKELLSKAVAAQDTLKALEGQRGEAEAALKTAATELEKQSTAQDAAVKAITEAARSLDVLRTQQGIDRQSELNIAATQEIGKVGADVTQAARDAIAAIVNNATSQGRAPNPIEQEAINRAQQLLNDTTPDAEQGGQLAGILQSLANNLNAKDAILAGGVEQLIGTTRALANKYKALADRIEDVAGQVNQTK